MSVAMDGLNFILFIAIYQVRWWLEKFSPCSIVLTYGVSKEAWNTGCIVYWNGSSNLYMIGDMTFSILKGL